VVVEEHPAAVHGDLHQRGGRFLVELGVVELVQAVLGKGKDVLGGSVIGHQGGEVGVLLLALLGGLGNLLVKGGNAIAERLDLATP